MKYRKLKEMERLTTTPPLTIKELSDILYWPVRKQKKPPSGEGEGSVSLYPLPPIPMDLEPLRPP